MSLILPQRWSWVEGRDAITELSTAGWVDGSSGLLRAPPVQFGPVHDFLQQLKQDQSELSEQQQQQQSRCHRINQNKAKHCRNLSRNFFIPAKTRTKSEF